MPRFFQSAELCITGLTQPELSTTSRLGLEGRNREGRHSFRRRLNSVQGRETADK